MDTKLIIHTILALLLLVIPACALYLLERGKLLKFVTATGRMIVQLLVVCLMVWALIKLNSIWLSLAWLILAALGSGWLVLRRSGLRMAMLPAVGGGLFLGVALVGFWFEEKMGRLTSELSDMFAKSHELEDEIRRKLGAIGYDV